MSGWPKFRIMGVEGNYTIQIAYDWDIWESCPKWLTRINGISFETLEEAKDWCMDYKKRIEDAETVVCVIE